MPNKKAFSIGFDGIGWLEGLEDDPSDCCAHAHAVARIGEESFEYQATVSATALYLLKSLREDHLVDVVTSAEPRIRKLSSEEIAALGFGSHEG